MAWRHRRSSRPRLNQLTTEPLSKSEIEPQRHREHRGKRRGEIPTSVSVPFFCALCVSVVKTSSMKLGVNSVLFGGHDMEVAFQYAQLCGYDGIEISAIDGMSEHLVLDRWQEIASRVKELSKQYNLPVMAMAQPSQDPAEVDAALQAAAHIG